jgi:hypothetical protein
LPVVLGDRRGMERSKGRTCRRRCCECRCWYMPAPSTKNTQKTCGKRCRQRRRAKQEKARRAVALLDARESERMRQREHRGRKRAMAGTTPPMSEAIEEIMEKLGQAQRLSQAGLRRELFRFARFSQGEMDHADPKSGTSAAAVTGRPRRRSSWNHGGKRSNFETMSLAGLALLLQAQAHSRA